MADLSTKRKALEALEESTKKAKEDLAAELDAQADPVLERWRAKLQKRGTLHPQAARVYVLEITPARFQDEYLGIGTHFSMSPAGKDLKHPWSYKHYRECCANFPMSITGPTLQSLRPPAEDVELLRSLDVRYRFYEERGPGWKDLSELIKKLSWKADGSRHRVELDEDEDADAEYDDKMDHGTRAQIEEFLTKINAQMQEIPK